MFRQMLANTPRRCQYQVCPEDFTADRRNGLRVQGLRRVAFYWGTTSGVDARLLSLREHAPQRILKVKVGISTVSQLITRALFGSFN